MNQLIFNVNEGLEDMRIDRYAADVSDGLSRSYIQKLIADGNLLVNQSPVKANYKVRYDDTICIILPDSLQPEILPEDIPLEIEYEDSDLLVVNKPKGMVIIPELL